MGKVEPVYVVLTAWGPRRLRRAVCCSCPTHSTQRTHGENEDGGDLLDLSELGPDKLAVGVALGVVLGQDSVSFFKAVLGGEPAW